MKKIIGKYYFEIILVMPLTLYILGFTILPIYKSILMGFTDNTTDTLSLINYKILFSRPQFINSISNTVFVALVSLVFQLVIGLIIALILKHKFKGKGFVRALVLMPMGIPTLVSGVMALYIFGTSGYLNEILFRLGIIDIPINWLMGGFRSLVVIILADTWKVLPTVVLLLSAGLEAIPNEVYEAAVVDGANPVQTFFKVTLPLLKSSITMALLFRAVDAFRIFELPQILVGQSNPFIATYSYEEYAIGNLNASGASSTILLVLIMSFTFLYLKFIDKGEGFSVSN